MTLQRVIQLNNTDFSLDSYLGFVLCAATDDGCDMLLHACYVALFASGDVSSDRSAACLKAVSELLL
jgi:hypothetical protein